MCSKLCSFYHAQQTRILLLAACFALITNIATIVVLFEQLEHEALCDQQNEWNEFVEGSGSAAVDIVSNRIDPQELTIPQPPEERDKTMEAQKQHADATTTAEGKGDSKTTSDKADKPLSITDVKGSDYRMHEFSSQSVRASDWEHVLKYTLPQNPVHLDPDQFSVECNPKKMVSHIFMNALSKWVTLREYGYFPLYDCPEWIQNEYRPSALVPHIYQTQCAPFWPSDVLYLLSHILSPSMRAIQYGFSLSTLWLANFVEKLKVVDHRQEKMENYIEFMEQHEFDSSNIEMEWQRMSRQYVEQIGPDRGHILDFVVLENVPEYHEDVLKYVVSVLRENDGVLIINFMDSDIPDNMEELIADLIPTQWIRYNSFAPDFLKLSVPFSQEQYLEKYNVSLWISRTLDSPC